MQRCHKFVVLKFDVRSTMLVDCGKTQDCELILGDPGAVSWVGRNGATRSFQERVEEPLHGYRLSPDHFQTASRMPATNWAQKILCIIVPNQRVLCVLTWSSRRESFVRHIALLVYRKSEALFMRNLTVNATRSSRTRRKICHVQVKSQFTETE